MTDQESRTASQIIRGEMPAGRVRLRTEPVLPVIRPAVNGGGTETRPVVFDIRDMAVFYGSNRALVGTTLKIHRNLVTAVIGPSGCGKSTFIRSLNRMNDSIPGFRLEGQVLYHGHDLYGSRANRVEVRRRIGMVFQKPNPFPKSIYDNVAWAARNLSMKAHLDDRVEEALRQAALWDEVKDRLHSSALGLSGGQQQRLCIARSLAIKPEVLLMDEPCSALDPISTKTVEALIGELRRDLAVVVVTHNLAQAHRIADKVAFMYLGNLVEYGTTDDVFEQPRAERTRDYVHGAFG